MSLRGLIQAWNKFFFEPVSAIPVALFRILYGCLVMIMLLTQSMPDWDFWYGPRSPVQMDMVRDHFYRCPVLNVFDLVPPAMVHDFQYVVLAATFCLTIGLFTRPAAVLTWLFLTSLDHQNPWNISGSDDFMRLTAFCLMFSSCGEALSVDRWWKRKHGDTRTKFSPVGQRMLQIQLALAYWGASVAKLGGAQWVDGTAVYYSSHFDDFFRLPVGHLFDSLVICQWFSWSTLVVEVALWTLIWFKELRYWVLLAGVGLHIGIDYTMTLPIFEMQFVAAYLTFIEPEDCMRVYYFIRRVVGLERTSSATARSPVKSDDFVISDGTLSQPQSEPAPAEK